MDELKPCPFCGQKPIVDRGYGFYRVMCNNHQCWILPKTDMYLEEDTAFDAWNERAEDGQ